VSTTRSGSSSSRKKCSTATSINAIGWLKSSTSRTPGDHTIDSGSRMSACTYAVRPATELVSSARECKSTSGSLST